MADLKKEREEKPPADPEERERANIAPDAVKDPSEKTDGKPGAPPQGDEVDPGAG